MRRHPISESARSHRAQPAARRLTSAQRTTNTTHRARHVRPCGHGRATPATLGPQAMVKSLDRLLEPLPCLWERGCRKCIHRVQQAPPPSEFKLTPRSPAQASISPSARAEPPARVRGRHDAASDAVARTPRSERTASSRLPRGSCPAVCRCGPLQMQLLLDSALRDNDPQSAHMLNAQVGGALLLGDGYSRHLPSGPIGPCLALPCLGVARLRGPRREERTSI
jgi:hypothetical protein